MNRYIYRLYLESGRTYIGQRTFKKEALAIEDRYFGSSSYIKNHPEDSILKKEILIENIQDQFTLNFLESVCIQDEKAYKGKDCVNGNLGGYIFGMCHEPWMIAKQQASRKGYRHSEETKEKLKQAWKRRKEQGFTHLSSFGKPHTKLHNLHVSIALKNSPKIKEKSRLAQIKRLEKREQLKKEREKRYHGRTKWLYRCIETNEIGGFKYWCKKGYTNVFYASRFGSVHKSYHFEFVKFNDFDNLGKRK